MAARCRPGRREDWRGLIAIPRVTHAGHYGSRSRGSTKLKTRSVTFPGKQKEF